MNTVVDNLQQMANEIDALLQELLLKHSSIYLWNKPDDVILVISPSGNYAYRELGEEGKRLQTRLLDEYRRFHALLMTLLKGQAQTTLEELSNLHILLSRTIEQGHTWCRTPQEALDKVQDALKQQVALLGRLYNDSNGEACFVPDTNALLYNPNIESWAFDGVQSFTMVLVPTVLTELDAHKINHSNEAVRQKAETLIKRVKEYRRRGRLTEGVTIVSGKIVLLAVATEPKAESTLPWLNFENSDDRLLGALVEFMRFRPASPVILVSRDINLQNKAEYARIPFCEPPEC